MADGSFFVPGKNCWQVNEASRLSVLVDAQEYFQAVAWAAERAKRSISVLSWEIDARISLLPKSEGGAYWSELAARSLSDFFLALVERNPNLHVHILAWDFLFLFRGERQPKAKTARDFRRHPRIHFRYDPAGPFLISHHQKVVVIDDQLAFCGGLDLTQRRWDTPAHRVNEASRRDPDGKKYEPFHDVMKMVEGAAARSLGALFRERWQRAAKALPPGLSEEPSPEPHPALWPAFLSPLLERQPVALARTAPAEGRAAAVTENVSLFEDSIRAAKDYIFVENQYFASRRIGRLLAERLAEPNPPEIVILVRLLDTNWSERLMGVLRARLVARLQRQDPHGKLLVLCPAASHRQGEWLNLHSKVFISDDRLLRVGSSNLCGRSEAMDTECDLAVYAETAKERAAVRSLRDQLLGEHLGVSPAELARVMEEEGSLLATVRRLLGREDRTLVNCPARAATWLEWLCPSTAIVDPENPRQFARGVRRVLVGIVLLLALGIGAFLLRPYFTQANLVALTTWVEAQPLAPVALTLVFTILVSCAFPLVPLAIAYSLVLPPVETFFCIMVGSLLSAAITYSLPRFFARHGEGGWTERLAESDRFRRLRAVVEREGFWPIVLIRLIPVAPFWIENVLLGLMGIRFGYFLLATFLSLLPGYVLIAFLEGAVSAHGNFLTTILVFSVAFALLGWGIQKGVRWFNTHGARRAHGG